MPPSDAPTQATGDPIQSATAMASALNPAMP